jgi:hypothetical protein
MNRILLFFWMTVLSYIALAAATIPVGLLLGWDLGHFLKYCLVVAVAFGIIVISQPTEL